MMTQSLLVPIILSGRVVFIRNTMNIDMANFRVNNPLIYRLSASNPCINPLILPATGFSVFPAIANIELQYRAFSANTFTDAYL